jgi:hypothetical protein
MAETTGAAQKVKGAEAARESEFDTTYLRVVVLNSKRFRGGLVCEAHRHFSLQGYLAHKKLPTPTQDRHGSLSRHGPTVGSYRVAVSYKRGAPVLVRIAFRVSR